MPFDSSNLMRYLGAASIAIAVFGGVVALYFLAGRNYGTMPGIGGYQAVFALAALWFTNLITMLVNVAYYLCWSRHNWLKVLIFVQLVVAFLAPVALD